MDIGRVVSLEKLKEEGWEPHDVWGETQVYARGYKRVTLQSEGDEYITCSRFESPDFVGDESTFLRNDTPTYEDDRGTGF